LIALGLSESGAACADTAVNAVAHTSLSRSSATAAWIAAAIFEISATFAAGQHRNMIRDPQLSGDGRC